MISGSCWPGVSSYLDFLNPDARDYYASWYSYKNFKNSTPTLSGVWNDMNEPSVFDKTTENTMPFEAVHYGNVKHRDIHNIYGFLQVKFTFIFFSPQVDIFFVDQSNSSRTDAT